MKIFEFEITETLQRKILVESDNEQEAFDKVKSMYRSGEILLGADDFVDSEINFICNALEE
ncbi:DpnD/PcfM family protein [Sedimentibacter sp. B4]|uniref:DpnD/PcfM family protein n=1 Tax=Sedimentibacter sp. B4 TaxID=304766 RepID=UPI0002F55027|nr:DpnD/PcfM family protein [Sedimentibacter sp. B4]